jgi:hypothetical protein
MTNSRTRFECSYFQSALPSYLMGHILVNASTHARTRHTLDTRHTLSVATRKHLLTMPPGKLGLRLEGTEGAFFMACI